MEATSGNAAASVATVRHMSGTLVAEVSPVPASIAELKLTIEAASGVPTALQKLVNSQDSQVYADTDELQVGEDHDIMLIKDETPLWTWDLEGNPSKQYLEVEGSTVRCPKMRTDFVNVITKEPIRSGVHYFEFVMHVIGDEQSCGLLDDPTQAGSRNGIRGLRAWTYYAGRMQASHGSIRDGKGALHAQGKAVKEFTKLHKEGDVIGMLVDMERGAVAFSLNGNVQGACEVPKTPLWLITHVDTTLDVVELRKPCLDDAPPEHLEALKGALLDTSCGEALRGI